MNDTIYRQVAIDALAAAMPSLTTPDGSGELDHDIQVTDEAYVDCMQIIHDLPSAQPDIDEWCIDCKEYDQQKHCCPRWNRVIRETVEEMKQKTGKWEAIEGWDGDVLYRCSECGTEFMLIDGTPEENDYHFCPHCGADMRGEQNDRIN